MRGTRQSLARLVSALGWHFRVLRVRLAGINTNIQSMLLVGHPLVPKRGLDGLLMSGSVQLCWGQRDRKGQQAEDISSPTKQKPAAPTPSVAGYWFVRFYALRSLSIVHSQ